MNQLSLLDVQPTFDGKTYEPELDAVRLSTQMERVRKLMSDGRWRSISAIARIVGGSEAGVSARLRDMRKSKWGSLTVERERVEGGLHRYRVLL